MEDYDANAEGMPAAKRAKLFEGSVFTFSEW
jgi:hypothetical protein